MDQQQPDNYISFETYLFYKMETQSGNEAIIMLIRFWQILESRDRAVNR